MAEIIGFRDPTSSALNQQGPSRIILEQQKVSETIVCPSASKCLMVPNTVPFSQRAQRYFLYKILQITPSSHSDPLFGDSIPYCVDQ